MKTTAWRLKILASSSVDIPVNAIVAWHLTIDATNKSPTAIDHIVMDIGSAAF